MDIRKLAVEETSFLHLEDATGDALYENGEPVGITLYGPGTKTYARAQQARQNRIFDRMKRKGKTDLTAEEAAKENAEFLAACTKQFHRIEMGGLKDEELFRAVYADQSVGFIAEQAMKHLGEWANFSKASSKT